MLRNTFEGAESGQWLDFTVKLAAAAMELKLEVTVINFKTQT